jgi:hypothetical protein
VKLHGRFDSLLSGGGYDNRNPPERTLTASGLWRSCTGGAALAADLCMCAPVLRKLRLMASLGGNGKKTCWGVVEAELCPVINPTSDGWPRAGGAT